MLDPSLDISIRVAAPQEVVWAALVRPRFRVEWWPELELRARVGSRVAQPAADGRATPRADLAGRVLDVDAPSRLHFKWGRRDAPRTNVEWLLEPKKHGRTRVRVVETGFERKPYAAIDISLYRDAWRSRLGDLDDYLASPGVVARIERRLARRS